MKNLYTFISLIFLTTNFLLAMDEAEKKQITELSKIRKTPADKLDKKKLEEFKKSKFESVKFFATALMYKSDPTSFDALYADFSVVDYALRDKGIYNMIEGDEFVAQIKKIEEIVDKEGLDAGSVTPLLVYMHYRNRNEWVMIKDQRLSTARIFRTAFLTMIFDGTELSSVDIANKIDLKAQKPVVKKKEKK